MNTLTLLPHVSSDKIWVHTQLADLVALVSEYVPEQQVIWRDLAELVPEPRTAAAQGAPCGAARALSDLLVSELAAAELLVIGAPIAHHAVTPALAQWSRRSAGSKGFGAPLYAMGLHPHLQAWFDHVIRADRTFRHTVDGPRGLLAGKKAIVLAAQTTPWRSAAMAAHQVHCIHTQLQFMGITEIATIESDRDANPARRPRRWEPLAAKRLAA
jgi:FMN-dependent NADH-azoreductase